MSDYIDPAAPMCACGHTRASHSPRGCLACAGPPCDKPKNERWPCPTDGCPGDVRYAAPRFSHLATCDHLRRDMAGFDPMDADTNGLGDFT